MKKLAPIVLALSLGARSLFGGPIVNPLESTILEETKQNYDITGSFDKGSLILDASLPMGNDWRVNFDSDMENTGKYLIINNLDMAIGNKNFYIGASFGDLSTNTILEGSNIFKVQTGIRLSDWFNFSLTEASINIPEMKTKWRYNTPVQLSAVGWNANLGKEFNLDSLKLFPWISTTGSLYYANPQDTVDFHSVNDNNKDSLTANTIAYPFNHLNVKGGLDVKTKFIDFRYQGEYEGQFWIPPLFNFTNKVGINLHDEARKMNMSYDVSLITKPDYPEIDAPTRNELEFNVSAFALFNNGFFIKEKVSALVNFLTPNQFNFVTAVGKRIGEGNLELFYNSQNNTFGLQYSTSLDKSTDKESKLRKNFYNINAPQNPNLSSPSTGITDLTLLHNTWGNTLEELVTKINSEQDISDLIASIHWVDHSGTFSAREEYEKYGYGTCRDTNGNLIPYLEKTALGNESYGKTLFGPYVVHVVTIIKNKNGKYNLRDYQNYYDLNADSPEKAIEAVYPGAYGFGNGDVTLPVSEVRESVEKSLYDWKKFQ